MRLHMYTRPTGPNAAGRSQHCSRHEILGLPYMTLMAIETHCARSLHAQVLDPYDALPTSGV